MVELLTSPIPVDHHASYFLLLWSFLVASISGRIDFWPHTQIILEKFQPYPLYHRELVDDEVPYFYYS